MTSTLKRMTLKARSGLVVAMLTGLCASSLTAADLPPSGCPWMVQPNEPIIGLGADIATYEILFAGNPTDAIFYGFTVADHNLARQLEKNDKIPDLRQHGRSLETVEQNENVVYRLSADSMSPRIIYLLSADKTVQQLELIDARINPARPVTVGWRTRGASDFSGPMPRRSVPGIEILASSSQKPEQEQSVTAPTPYADFQLCAYQVSWY